MKQPSAPQTGGEAIRKPLVLQCLQWDYLSDRHYLLTVVLTLVTKLQLGNVRQPNVTISQTNRPRPIRGGVVIRKHRVLRCPKHDPLPNRHYLLILVTKLQLGNAKLPIVTTTQTNRMRPIRGSLDSSIPVFSNVLEFLIHRIVYTFSPRRGLCH